MKYIYGPLNSRRLGFSLGITLTPYKICSFDCIYCQLGATSYKTEERKEYIEIENVFVELKMWLENNSQEAKKINYITFSGSGEPTLNIKIGGLIKKIKEITNIPIAVITNASLLRDPALRQELLAADLLIPSLDAVVPEIFIKIDRPDNGIKIEDIVDGLIALRGEFKGKIWLEVMLVRGVNADLRHIRKVKEIIAKINPDKIQLNSPVRATAVPDLLAVTKNKLEKIKEILGEKCEII